MDIAYYAFLALNHFSIIISVKYFCYLFQESLEKIRIYLYAPAASTLYGCFREQARLCEITNIRSSLHLKNKFKNSFFISKHEEKTN